MFKYPRTQHIRGSRFQHGDHDLEAAPWSELAGKYLVVEEKVDGANCGISFSHEGELLLQSRGHYLRGGPREAQFNLLKQWASCHRDAFFNALGTKYVMYGEWLYAKHTYFYDALPHYFMEFDVLDKDTGLMLSTKKRRQLLNSTPVTSVLVLHEGIVDSVKELASFIGRSNFITDHREEQLKAIACAGKLDYEEVKRQTDMSTDMEGLYVKIEDDNRVHGRYKYIRESFTSSIIDQEQHWHDRPIIANHLLPETFDKMFE